MTYSCLAGTLTTGTDNYVGTASNDTITGTATAADTTKDLYQAQDAIDGGAGTDTLRVTVGGDISAQTPIIKNVEILEARSVNAAAKIDASASSLTKLVNANSTAALEFANIGAVTSLSVSDSAGASTFTYANDKLGASGALTLAVSSYGTAASSRDVTVVVGGADVVKTLSVDATGTNNITIKEGASTIGDTLTKLVVTGTGSLKVISEADGGDADANGTLASLTTVDASANTGGVNIDLATGGNAKDVTFTGGSGNDRVAFSATNLTVNDKLAAGDGTDTLAIADTAIDANLSKAVKATTGFEKLEYTGTAALTWDVSLAGISTITTSGAVTTAGAAGADGAKDKAGANGADAGADAVAVTGLSTQAFEIGNSITATGGAGGAGGVGSAAGKDGQAGGVGGAGKSALIFTPLVDNGSNAVTVTLKGVTLNSSGANGGAGGAAGDVTADKGGAGGKGGAADTVIDATNIETVNIVSATNSTGTVTVNTLTAIGGTGGKGGAGKTAGADGAAGADGSGLTLSNNGTVNISGAADLVLGTVVSTNVTIKAAGLSGALTVATGNGNDVIEGGSGKNTITLNGGVDSINLTASVAKQDTINVAAVTNSTTAALVTALTGVTTGSSSVGDKIDIAGTNTVAANSTGVDASSGLTRTVTNGIITFSGTSSSTTLANYLDAAFDAVAQNKAAAFVFNGDTYVIANAGNDATFDAGADYVVKLVGVTDLTALVSATTDMAAGKLFIA